MVVGIWDTYNAANFIGRVHSDIVGGQIRTMMNKMYCWGGGGGGGQFSTMKNGLMITPGVIRDTLF